MWEWKILYIKYLCTDKYNEYYCFLMVHNIITLCKRKLIFFIIRIGISAANKTFSSPYHLRLLLLIPQSHCAMFSNTILFLVETTVYPTKENWITQKQFNVWHKLSKYLLTWVKSCVMCMFSIDYNIIYKNICILCIR